MGNGVSEWRRILEGMSGGTFAVRLQATLTGLRCSYAFTPAGLRSGGATWQWIVSRNFEFLRLRGRWTSARTLEAYIQECATQISEGERTRRKTEWFEQLEESGIVVIEN